MSPVFYTLSSAIASNLAKGYDLQTSIQRAKDYISGALAAMLDLGKGSGPMNHAFNLSGEFEEENNANQIVNDIMNSINKNLTE